MKYSTCFITIIMLLGGAMNAPIKQGSNPSPSATARTDHVEIKNDRFSGETTITLKPQVILEAPDRLITMSLEAKIRPKRIEDVVAEVMRAIDEMVLVRFEAQAKSISVAGDTELHFIIDGKRLKVVESARAVLKFGGPDPSLKPGFRSRELFSNGLTVAQLSQVAKGHAVEMRLGQYEMTIPPSVLSNFQHFLGEFRRLRGTNNEK
jgi:hypothetical protein